MEIPAATGSLSFKNITPTSCRVDVAFTKERFAGLLGDYGSKPCIYPNIQILLTSVSSTNWNIRKNGLLSLGCFNHDPVNVLFP